MNAATKKKSLEKTKPKESSSTKIFGNKVMDHGYTGVPNILVRAQSRIGISTTQFNIIVQLLSYWIYPDRPPFPGKKELANRMGINPVTLRKNIAELEKAGLIKRVQRKTSAGDYGSNTYKLDGLIKKLQSLVPDFDKEREERQAAKKKVETKNAKLKAEMQSASEGS